MADNAPPLSQAVGYGVVIGLGLLMAVGMMLITYVLRRYNNELQTSEAFSTAGRTVKSGLVASAVVSSWTWAATLLQSTTVTYQYGVSGAFWYASGATVQVLLFATLAIELKRRAPNAHTFLEIIRARYGGATHAVYLTFAMMTNVLVTAMLLTGGGAVFNSLTGMNTVAAIFLLPVGVVMYTVFGGIKATLLTDWANGAVVILIIFVFAFVAFATGDQLGSPSAVYDALVAAAERHPVEGNSGGSYLTMRSAQGGVFFVINISGNFGTIFNDNGYYQKAIAASPVHALPGYIIGGLSWFAIPWLCATTLGLTALATENTPAFPTFPERMLDVDVTAGLVLPNAARALLGANGAAAAFLLLFMAVTSAMSSELIAVSSIWTYDIFQQYVNPGASGRRLVHVSHISCVAFSVIMAAFSTGLFYAGISMGYLYLMMGVIITGAVLPASLTLLWDRQSWAAATFSPPLSLACSLTAWLVTARLQGGGLSVATTGANIPMLAGNVTGLLGPVVFSPLLTIVFPTGKYDWQSMREIRRADDHDVAADAHIDLEQTPGGAANTTADEEAEAAHLNRSAKIARTMTVTLAVSLLVLWPMPMFGSGYIFSKSFFTGWIVVGIIWLFGSSVGVGLFPLWQGRGTMKRTFTSICKDLSGGNAKVTHGRATMAEVAEVEEKRDQAKGKGSGGESDGRSWTDERSK